MIVHRRAPKPWVFAVDHDAVQFTWRALRAGHLRAEVLAGSSPIAEPLDLELADATSVLASPERARRSDAGAATISGIPAGRLLTLRLSGTALDGTVERAFRTLSEPPGPQQCRIATISDLHLGARSFGQRGTIRDPESHPEHPPWRCAAGALDEAAAWGIDHLVVKGDLTNAALPQQWRSYARLIERCPVPVDAVAGNHDAGRYGGRRSIAPADAAEAFGLSLALPLIVRDLPGVRLVLADTTIPGRHHGTVAPIAPLVLDVVADAPRDEGVLLVLHHHLHPHLVPEGPPFGVAHDEARRFVADLSRAHPNVVVTSGHSHRNRRWGRGGVVVTQVGATQDYPGVWAGYRVHEGGLSQVVRRIESPECTGWTDHSRIAGFGLWEHLSPGRLDARCFDVRWAVDHASAEHLVDAGGH